VPLKGIRLYRSADLGNGSAEFLLVFDSTQETADPAATAGLINISVTATTASFEYIDHKKTEDLGMALFTDPNWLPPPDGVRALCVMRNGIMCAYKESTVYFAHAYRPYAWDRTKSITFPQSVRALMPFSNGLLVFTSGPLFFVAGQSADALSYQQVQGTHGLILNPRAWVETDKGAVFATDDGFCVTDGNTVSNELSLKLLTRKGWQALFANVTDRMRLAWWDGKLIAYATEFTWGILIDFDEAEGQVTMLDNFTNVTCHTRWPEPDTLILVEAGATPPRYSSLFGHATAKRGISYLSRMYELPQPVCFASLQVRQEGTSTIHLFKDVHHDAVDFLTPTTLNNYEAVTSTNGAGVTIIVYRPKNNSTASCPYSKPPSCSITCTGDNIIRLPSGFKARKWWYVIQGAGVVVRSIHLALSADELKGV